MHAFAPAYSDACLRSQRPICAHVCAGTRGNAVCRSACVHRHKLHMRRPCNRHAAHRSYVHLICCRYLCCFWWHKLCATKSNISNDNKWDAFTRSAQAQRQSARSRIWGLSLRTQMRIGVGMSTRAYADASLLMKAWKSVDAHAEHNTVHA